MKLDPFGNLHTKPFTEEDIERLEEIMDVLIRDFFQDSDDLEYILRGDLVEKLEGYLAIARYSVTDPDLSELHDDAAVMAEVLEETVRRVKAYYHNLN